MKQNDLRSVIELAAVQEPKNEEWVGRIMQVIDTYTQSLLNPLEKKLAVANKRAKDVEDNFEGLMERLEEGYGD